MAKFIQAPRGMHDFLPEDSTHFSAVIEAAQTLSAAYGYRKIQTPMVEKTEVFSRAIGGATDVVAKEMYSWRDNNGESLSLRPEGTAAVARMMIEHHLPRQGAQKIFYHGPMFRHERPQKGRHRQFHQFGAEIFGIENIEAEVELIDLTNTLWAKLGITPMLEINSLGDSHARKNHRHALVDYLNDHKNQLDEDSRRRLKTNPLRILDSKNPALSKIIKAAPKTMDYLNAEDREDFARFENYLAALNIAFRVNHNLVRGLDYYTRTVFEWTAKPLGAQNAICAGGRYDGLIEKMGGTPTPGVGFAVGIERLILLMAASGQKPKPPAPMIFVIASGEAATQKSFETARKLRRALPRFIVYNHLPAANLKAQFKKADKLGADYAIIIGEQELENQMLSLKPLKNQEKQVMRNFDEIVKILKNAKL